VEEKMSIGYWFIIFLLIGGAGLILIIVETRSALGEVYYLIKNKRMRKAVDNYSDWVFVLLIYLIIFCVITNWFVVAPH